MRVTFSLMMIVVLIAGSAIAQDVQSKFAGYSNAEKAFAAQRQAMDDFEARLTSVESGQKDQPLSKSYFNDDCDGHQGAYVGAEMVIAKPYFEDEVDVNRSDEVGYDFSLTPRVWMGYRNDQGTGIRARYWVFDQSTVAPHSMIPATASLNVRSVDLELTKVAHIGSIAAEFLGGLRYGKVEHLWNSEGVDFEGVGPQLGVDLSIPTQTNISLYGGTRAAVLFGSTKNADTDEIGMSSPGEDDLVPVFELRLGTEYTRCLGSGWFTLRSGVEAQFWAAGSADPNSDLSSDTSSDENLGFLGYVIGAEFRR